MNREHNWVRRGDLKTESARYVLRQLGGQFYGGPKDTDEAARIAYTASDRPLDDVAIALLISNAYGSSPSEQMQSYCRREFSDEQIALAQKLQTYYRSGSQEKLASQSAEIKMAVLATRIVAVEQFAHEDNPGWVNNFKKIGHERWVQSALGSAVGKTPEGSKALRERYEEASRNIEREKAQLARDIRTHGHRLYRYFCDYRDLGGIDSGLDCRFEVAMDRAQDALSTMKKRCGFDVNDPQVATEPVPRFGPVAGSAAGILRRMAAGLGLRIAG